MIMKLILKAQRAAVRETFCYSDSFLLPKKKDLVMYLKYFCFLTLLMLALVKLQSIQFYDLEIETFLPAYNFS